MKKRMSQANKKNLLRTIVIAITFIIALEVPYLLIKYQLFGENFEQEAAIGLFEVVITAIGALFVVFEMQSSDHTNCCMSLADLNFRFIENPRLMLLYQKLGECFKNPDLELEVIDDNDDSHVHSADLMAYLTFYEVLFENIDHGLMNIEQMDDLFGDRFFKVIHNNYVQENELYAEPSSYSNIFQLYTLWYEHRTKSAAKDGSRLVAMPENAIPVMYLKQKLYMHETHYLAPDKGKHTFTNSKGQSVTLHQKRLFPRSLKQVLALQKQICGEINNVDVFKYSTEEEILESMLIDYCYGLFDGKKLVAVCIGVMNRESPRNLCKLVGDANFQNYASFDSVQVAKEYRGYGIQQFFLADFQATIQGLLEANMTDHITILATVSPKNDYSLNNFTKAGYTHGDVVSAYGSQRYVVQKQLADIN